MNPAAVAYTPLECFLLFQSLVTYGTDDKSFVRITDLLTNNAFVKHGSTYDPERLRTESLRELYLQLLCDELRSEDKGLEDGSQPGSKKRKILIPTLSTIKDAEKHRDKLPFLVDRLYVRYKNSMAEAIKEDEKRYAILQQEVQQIERGEWDERILKEDKAIANRNGSVSPNEARLKINDSSAVPAVQVAEVAEVPRSHPLKEPPKRSPLLLSPHKEFREDLDISNVLTRRGSIKRTSPQISETKSNLKSKSGDQNPTILQRLSSNGPHGPSPLQPAPRETPLLQQDQLQSPGHQEQQMGIAYKWEPPYGSTQLTQPYQHGAQYPLQFTPQPYPQLPRGPLPSPHGVQHFEVPSSPLNVQHSHPGMLPPPNGGHRSTGSSHDLPLDTLADATGQQYRVSSEFPMSQPPQMPVRPTSSDFAQPYLSQQRPTSGNGHPHRKPPFMTKYQGPPHQGTLPQVPSQLHPLQTPTVQRPYPPQPSLDPPETRQYTSPYNVNEGPRSPSTQSFQKIIPSLPNTPTSQRKSRFFTGTGTRWTPNPTGSTPRTFCLTDRPAVEPISPVLRPAKPAASTKFANNQTPRSEPKLKKAPPKRGAQRTKVGSTASPLIASSCRSQSVASLPDELSLDDTAKQEVATPLALHQSFDEETGETTAEGFPNIRQPSNIILPPSRLKRKRNGSAVEIPRESTGPVSNILWTRAFPKISASALESVTGHRHASMFAAPVKERDAPGYKTLILRPQDLKSIKSAILAGHRAATAAMPDETPQAQSSLWLPISEDLIPPRGIINYAQLEKELMRMFSNAIMFNADPDRGLGAPWEEMRGRGKKGGEGYEIDEDGVVKDTRAMYGDVEKIIGSLRSAERRSEEMMALSGVKIDSIVRESSVGVIGEEDGPDELAGDTDAAAGNIAKRRRKA